MDTVENNVEASQKTKNRASMWPSNSTPGYLPEKNENTNLNREHAPQCHTDTIYNCQVW